MPPQFILLKNMRPQNKLITLWYTVKTGLVPMVCVCLIWIFTSHQQYFSYQVTVFLGWTSTKLGLMCLAQGHNAVTPMRLEPTALRSQVKHFTTEPLRSLYGKYIPGKYSSLGRTWSFFALTMLHPDIFLFKQSRSRSAGFREAIWSGSTLFSTLFVNTC